MRKKYRDNKASTLPAPYEKITDWWQKLHVQQKRVTTQRRKSIHDTWENKGRKKEFAAMYCPVCHEWNNEQGEFYGCCNYCGELLEVV